MGTQTLARIALGVEYNGSNYRGWQAQQEGVVTVQETLETALAKVADRPVRTHCAGRTDARVHATGQVVHFDTDAERPMRAWVYGVNSNLPDDIAVRWAVPVDDAFHARFSARWRCYRYVIHNDPVRPALFNRELTWNYRPLDIEAMTRASRALLGTHDFSSFRGAYCQAKSPVKTIEYLNLRRQGSLVVLEIKADAFLMHMVRNIAGVLMAIGAGARPESWCAEVLAHRDRTRGGPTAPPFGLYLVAIGYPDEFALPPARLGPWWLPDTPIADAWRDC